MTLKQKELKIENQNLKKTTEEIEESLKVVFSYTFTLMCFGKVFDTNFRVYSYVRSYNENLLVTMPSVQSIKMQ